MLQIENWKVYDLKESVIACRNAMRITPAQITDEEFNASMPRAIMLANSQSGSGHQTFLSGIRVSFDIKYPNYISPDLQRYHWIDIVSSSSKMHRLSFMDMDTCFNKYVTDESKEQMKRLVKKFNDTKSYEDFMVMLSNCPQGVELFMRVSTNYLQLRTLYRQRKTHKLKEDYAELCAFIENLRYAKEIILGNNSNN